jgi:hypothetical protein
MGSNDMGKAICSGAKAAGICQHRGRGSKDVGAGGAEAGGQACRWRERGREVFEDGKGTKLGGICGRWRERTRAEDVKVMEGVRAKEGTKVGSLRGRWSERRQGGGGSEG